RADVYWLVHVDVMDNPHTREYIVEQLVPNKLIRIDFKLGFREEQRISLLFRKVVEDMVEKGEIDITSNYETLKKYRIDRKSTRLNSSHVKISYAVFCLKKKKNKQK